jgi:hypothetical protein
MIEFATRMMLDISQWPVGWSVAWTQDRVGTQSQMRAWCVISTAKIAKSKKDPGIAAMFFCHIFFLRTHPPELCFPTVVSHSEQCSFPMAPSPHSTPCTFDARLYASFGPQLKQVKIRGSLEKLSSRRGWWVMIGGEGCCRCKFRSVVFGRWGFERFESQDLDMALLFWEGRFWSQVPQGISEQDEASSFSPSLGWQVVLILLEPLGWTAQGTWNGLDMTWGRKEALDCWKW